MTKIEIAKKIATTVVGLGTTKIAADVITKNTNPKGAVDLVTMYPAAIVIGYMISEKTEEWTSAKIDAGIDWWNENVKKDN